MTLPHDSDYEQFSFPHRHIANRVFKTEELTSTNAVLLNDPEKIFQSGDVLWSLKQSKGRGRFDRVWESREGGLCFSILFEDIPALSVFYPFVLLCALAVRNVLADRTHEDFFSIRWPNDIYADDKKMGGILISNTISGQDITLSIIGIGLNVNQTVFPEWIPNPVSVKQLLGMHADREALLAKLEMAITERLNMLNQATGESKLDEDYLEMLYQLHDWKFYRVNGEEILGSITGVNEYGHLQLDTNEGRQLSCDLKEVVFL